MRFFSLFLIFTFSVCTEATENDKNSVVSATCDIFFIVNGPCVYKGIIVNVRADKVSDNEKQLKSLHILNDGRIQTLKIVDDVFMFDGDRGYVSFADINFDGYPDIAITTSFGLANLYLDYWVYEPHRHTYQYIGNYAKFELNTRLKNLSNEVKVSAVKYEKNTYYWEESHLIKK